MGKIFKKACILLSYEVKGLEIISKWKLPRVGEDPVELVYTTSDEISLNSTIRYLEHIFKSQQQHYLYINQLKAPRKRDTK